MRLIDADDLVEWLKILPNYTDMVLNAIHDTPTIEERKTGKWIIRRGAINCSVCHDCKWSLVYEDLVRSFIYCPSCGARMDKE